MKIAAIVITFHPDIKSLTHTLAALKPQVDQIIIVDNGSNTEAVNWLNQQQIADKIFLISLNDNQGIATAQNLGIKHAIQAGHTHILLMDQDSVPALDMVNKLIIAFTTLQKQNVKIAAVGPKYVDIKTNSTAPFIRYGAIKKHYITCQNNDAYLSVDSLIASGTLISTEAITDIGHMEEEFFIDNVDIAWCLAAKAKGWQLYGVCDAVLTHNLGEHVTTVWFFGKRTVPVHSPLRLYYMIRNSLLLCHKDYAHYQWYLQTAYIISIRFFIFSILVSPRWRNLKMMWRGLCDGVRGKKGKLI